MLTRLGRASDHDLQAQGNGIVLCAQGIRADHIARDRLRGAGDRLPGHILWTGRSCLVSRALTSALALSQCVASVGRQARPLFADSRSEIQQHNKLDDFFPLISGCVSLTGCGSV
jgi:hypothetical protein